MNSSQGFVTLNSIVMELLAQLRQTTLHKYVWLLNYALISYRKHLYSTIPITKTCTVKVSATKTIPYPSDYIGLIKMAVQNGDRLVQMFEDTTLNRQSKDDVRYTPSELRDRRYSYQSLVTQSHSVDDVSMFRGMGIDTNGVYKDNMGKRCFELSVDARINKGDTVVMEYISNGFEPDTETLVYLPAAELIKSHAMYQWFLYKDGGQARQTESWRIVYLRDLAEYKANTSNLSKDSILAAMARTASLQPKF